MNNLETYAIILIYPDGLIENIKLDKRRFHMQYFLSLAKESKRLEGIINSKKIQMPKNDINATLMLTYEIDEKLAEEGVIAFHNLLIDDETLNDFYITVPNKLSDEQNSIMKSIIENYDMSKSWYGILEQSHINDTTYDEIIRLINNKTKK